MHHVTPQSDFYLFYVNYQVNRSVICHSRIRINFTFTLKTRRCIVHLHVTLFVKFNQDTEICTILITMVEDSFHWTFESYPPFVRITSDRTIETLAKKCSSWSFLN
jgi:hypothetical protein